MNSTVRRPARDVAALRAALLLVGPFGPAGCDDPTKGTVQVSSDTHAHLQPRVSRGKFGPAAAGKAADAKPDDAKPVN